MRKPYCRAPKRVFEPLVLRLFPIFIHEKSSVFFHFVASLRISIAKPFGVFLLVAALAGCDTSAHPSRKTGEIGPTSTGSNNQTDTPLTVDSPIADTSQSKSNQTNSDEFEIAAQGLENLPTVSSRGIVGKQREQQRYHRVIAGETLSRIAKDNGRTLKDLLQANGLSKEATIHPGQLIYLPPPR